jgi:hypothetical protein
LEIEKNGGKAYAFKCDLSSREEVYAVAQKVFKAQINLN